MIRRLLLAPIVLLRMAILWLFHRDKCKRLYGAIKLCWFCESDELCSVHKWEVKTLIRHGEIRPLYWEWWPRDSEVSKDGYVSWTERESATSTED